MQRYYLVIDALTEKYYNATFSIEATGVRSTKFETIIKLLPFFFKLLLLFTPMTIDWEIYRITEVFPVALPQQL